MAPDFSKLLYAFRYKVKIGPKDLLSLTRFSWEGSDVVLERFIFTDKPTLFEELEHTGSGEMIVELFKKPQPKVGEPGQTWEVGRTWRISFEQIVDRGLAHCAADDKDPSCEAVVLKNAKVIETKRG